MQKIFPKVICKTFISIFFMLPFFSLAQTKPPLPSVKFPKPIHPLPKYIPQSIPKADTLDEAPERDNQIIHSPTALPRIIPSKDNISGLGPFLLNRTTTKYIDTLSACLNKGVTTCSEQSEVDNKKNSFIIQLKADSLTHFLLYGSYSPDVAVY